MRTFSPLPRAAGMGRKADPVGAVVGVLVTPRADGASGGPYVLPIHGGPVTVGAGWRPRALRCADRQCSNAVLCGRLAISSAELGVRGPGSRRTWRSVSGNHGGRPGEQRKSALGGD